MFGPTQPIFVTSATQDFSMVIAMFIPLCICALLGIAEAATQVYLFTHNISEPSITDLSFFCFWIFKLDFGTYKIVNRALQSSLCSHETGERIYVSTQGYPCARELVGMSNVLALD